MSERTDAWREGIPARVFREMELERLQSGAEYEQIKAGELGDVLEKIEARSADYKQNFIENVKAAYEEFVC